nr:PREDICTED: uncharacterized protein LOC109031159 [Bemisia tabaci]
MTRVTRRSTKAQRHDVSSRTSNSSKSQVSHSKSTNSSRSTMDSHPTQTSIISEQRKSIYSETDHCEYFGKSSTEAVVGSTTYLNDSIDSERSDELFNDNRSFRTPDWRKKVNGNHEDYANNVRQALCSTAKKTPINSSKFVSTPHMSTLQSRLIKRASMAAEKEMALIEKRVSLKKASDSANSSIHDVGAVRTPARPPSFIDLSKIKPVPMSVDVHPSPETPSFETPASTLASPYGMTKISSAVIGAGLRTPLFSKIATPVTSLGGPKRLTVQRASLEMSTILKGVVAYVEVRTNHDNLSQGVKTHLRTLGAHVEENFTKKVTHVIFKEGLMSTYKKAERWGVPLVSALWIEACKSQRKVVPAEEFPPIDIDRYKNALPFKRFRKKRSIQPIGDVRRLPARSTRKVNKLGTTVEEPSSVPAKGNRCILNEINKELKNDPKFEDKYLQTLLTLAGPYLEEALNRSDSPTNEGDLFLPLSVRLLKKYMTPRGTQTESKLTQVRVSELEKHLNLNPKGRSRLRKFLVFSSEDEAGTANRSSKTDKESESEDDTISPVEPPKVIRKSAPARLLTSRKKRRKNAKGTTQKKSLVQKPTVIVNKRKTQQVENKENLNVDRAKAGINMDTKIESKTQKPPSKMNSAVKRKLLQTSQLIMLDAPVEDLSIRKPVPRMKPLPPESSPKKRKFPPTSTTKVSSQSSTASSGSRYSEMYRLMSSDEEERNSAAWFATPRRNKTLPKPVLVCTSLHTNESVEVNTIVGKLGLFETATKVNPQTTHVVAGGPRRTLNLVKGMARGCWIVRKEWALDSFKAGRWLYEEPYELTEFSPVIKEVRLQRQCYKFLFSLDIFSPCGSIYVCQKTVPPRDDLKEILRLCSATVVSSAKSAKIVIGNNVTGNLNVQEKWVLDCVSQNKLLSTDSYTIKKTDNGKTQ